jgi:dTDP-4-amino-4,6-dideoxygalactose transaminase
VVFCDVNEETATIDTKKIQEKVTDRTVGVIPVHLYGQPAHMVAIMEIATANNIWVLEDCAQAHFASIDGRKVGTFGVAGTFSFYPGKNLGAMGDAGAIITQDGELASKMAMFARHGGLKKGEHLIEGINSRMDGLQAAILSVKLKHITSWIQRRQSIAEAYNKELSAIDWLKRPKVIHDRTHVWHLYVIKTQFRDDLMQFLGEKGVQTVVNYRCALPFLPCYQFKKHIPEDFPVSWSLQEQALSLPIFPEMEAEQLKRVIDCVNSYKTK